jgi:hypothetical protein
MYIYIYIGIRTYAYVFISCELIIKLELTACACMVFFFDLNIIELKGIRHAILYKLSLLRDGRLNWHPNLGVAPHKNDEY